MVKRHWVTWGVVHWGGGGGGTGGVVGTGCTMQDRAVGLERVAAYIVGVGGAGIAQWLEHRTRD